jgi:hypothetical protein
MPKRPTTRHSRRSVAPGPSAWSKISARFTMTRARVRPAKCQAKPARSTWAPQSDAAYRIRLSWPICGCPTCLEPSCRPSAVSHSPIHAPGSGLWIRSSNLAAVAGAVDPVGPGPRWPVAPTVSRRAWLHKSTALLPRPHQKHPQICQGSPGQGAAATIEPGGLSEKGLRTEHGCHCAPARSRRRW